jgi:hypothetical protein
LRTNPDAVSRCLAAVLDPSQRASTILTLADRRLPRSWVGNMIPLIRQDLSANAKTDVSTPTASLRGGDGTFGDDLEIMLARFKKGNTTYGALEDEDDDVGIMLPQLERLKASHGRSSNDCPKNTAPQLGKRRL